MSLYDDNEFENLFRNNYIDLCNYAARFVTDHQVVEDVVQNFFITIWEKKYNSVTKETFIPYARRSVKNSCINYLKHHALKENYLKILEQEWKEEMNTKEESQYSQQIMAAVDKLPTKNKEVFLLKYASDLKYKEIANVLNISVNTVKYHLKEAYKILRKELALIILLFLIR